MATRRDRRYQLPVFSDNGVEHYFHNQSRIARMKQVRAQEAQLSHHRLHTFRARRRAKGKKILASTKNAWEETRKKQLSFLHFQYDQAVGKIGQSHACAQAFEYNKKSGPKIAPSQFEAVIHQRYKEAMKQESIQKEKMREHNIVACRRRKTKESVAHTERCFARFVANNMVHSHSTTKIPGINRSPSSLQPSEYNETFLHAQTPHPPSNEELDAWKAAELQRKSLDHNKVVKIEIRSAMEKRAALRGQAAISHMLINKKIERLEKKLEMLTKGGRGNVDIRSAPKARYMVKLLKQGNEDQTLQSINRGGSPT